jgi:hypothetical protein
MKKLSGKFGVLRKITEEQIERWSKELMQILRQTIENEAVFIDEYVEQLKRLNPGISNEELSRKIIWRKSLKASGVGAICNLGGFITLPVTMPAELYWCFKIQAQMVLGIACLYGWNIHDEDMATDILLVMVGNAAINVIGKAGARIGQDLAKKAVSNFITREMMKKINRILSRRIITKAGQKSLTSFAKLAPVVAVPIGAGIDLVGTRQIGKMALRFYKG